MWLAAYHRWAHNSTKLCIGAKDCMRVFFTEIFNHTFWPSKEQRTTCLKRVSEDHGQASTVVPPVAFGDRSECFRQIVEPPKLPKTDFLDCGDKSVDSIEVEELLTYRANQAACKKNEGVVLNAHLVQCTHLTSKGEVLLPTRSAAQSFCCVAPADPQSKNTAAAVRVVSVQTHSASEARFARSEGYGGREQARSKARGWEASCEHRRLGPIMTKRGVDRESRWIIRGLYNLESK
ncbi:hypothetical protein L7F22_051177 [Adiantum nelumboides]|nr:hypothetical protein [Adiantum nelumboides]